MVTKIKDKRGNIITFRTQQYSIGTYIIINDDPSHQGCLDVGENMLHIRIRSRHKELGSEIIFETPIDEEKLKQEKKSFKNKKEYQI